MEYVLLLAADPVTYCLCRRFLIGQLIAIALGVVLGIKLASPWKWTGGLVGAITGWLLVVIARFIWCSGPTVIDIFYRG
jgi:hypothetical protein